MKGWAFLPFCITVGTIQAQTPTNPPGNPPANPTNPPVNPTNPPVNPTTPANPPRPTPVPTIVPVTPLQAATTGTILDSFDSVTQWTGAPAEGVEVSVHPDSVGGHPTSMRIDFDFHGHGGYAVVHRAISVTLPANYEFSFDIRGDAPVVLPAALRNTNRARNADAWGVFRR